MRGLFCFVFKSNDPSGANCGTSSVQKLHEHYIPHLLGLGGAALTRPMLVGQMLLPITGRACTKVQLAVSAYLGNSGGNIRISSPLIDSKNSSKSHFSSSVRFSGFSSGLLALLSPPP